MRKTSTLIISGALAAASMLSSSCNDSKSYAELLTEEAKAINVFLAMNDVEMNVPADIHDFITGENAPFYRLDEDSNVYMQIIEQGDLNAMVQNDQLVYFRFQRYSIPSFDPLTNSFTEGWGNSEDLELGSTSFRYGNYSLSSTTQWGTGIQMPLAYVGLNSRVRLIIRSQYGLTSEISLVTPYLYDIRYMPEGNSGTLPDPSENPSSGTSSAE